MAQDAKKVVCSDAAVAHILVKVIARAIAKALVLAIVGLAALAIVVVATDLMDSILFIPFTNVPANTL